MSPSITDAGREHPWFRGGKADPDPSKPRLRFSAFARVPLIQPPDSVDWVPAGIDWQMYGNDAYGDCEFAEEAHQIHARSLLAGHEVVPSTADVLQQYADVTGFRTDDPDTDQGVVLQDALNAWRKVGFPVTVDGKVQRRKILAFAEVDHRNPDELLAALYLFGALSLGFQIPAFAMDQHEHGEAWDVPPAGADTRILGGHAVNGQKASRPAGSFLVGAKRTASGLRLWVVTWAGLQEVTWAFFQRYCDEAWGTITEDWFGPDGRTPAGIDRGTLGEQFRALTGEDDPFPPSPAPVPDPPAPDPTPTPSPVTDVPTAADRALWTHVQHWIHQPHLMPSARTVARELRTWAAAKGLTAGGH